MLYLDQIRPVAATAVQPYACGHGQTFHGQTRNCEAARKERTDLLGSGDEVRRALQIRNVREGDAPLHRRRPEVDCINTSPRPKPESTHNATSQRRRNRRGEHTVASSDAATKHTATCTAHDASNCVLLNQSTTSKPLHLARTREGSGGVVEDLLHLGVVLHELERHHARLEHRHHAEGHALDQTVETKNGGGG